MAAVIFLANLHGKNLADPDIRRRLCSLVSPSSSTTCMYSVDPLTCIHKRRDDDRSP